MPATVQIHPFINFVRLLPLNETDQRPVQGNQKQQNDRLNDREREAHLEHVTRVEISVRIADDEDGRLIDEDLAAD